MRRCMLEGERSDVVELTVLRLHAFLWSRAVLCVHHLKAKSHFPSAFPIPKSSNDMICLIPLFTTIEP